MNNRSKLILAALFLIILAKVSHFSWVGSNSSTAVFSHTDHKTRSTGNIGPFDGPYHLVFHGLEPADNREETGLAIDVFVDKSQSVHSILIPFFKRMRIESMVNYRWIHPLKELGPEESGFFEIHVRYRTFGAHSENETEQKVMNMLHEGIREKISADINAVLSP